MHHKLVQHVTIYHLQYFVISVKVRSQTYSMYSEIGQLTNIQLWAYYMTSHLKYQPLLKKRLVEFKYMKLIFGHDAVTIIKICKRYYVSALK